MAKGLEDAVGVVNETRQTIIGALQHHIATKAGLLDPYRFANLLLLLPPLEAAPPPSSSPLTANSGPPFQAISQNLKEDLQLASMFGMARFDSLLQVPAPP